jgi:hypothetical protein
MTSSEHVKQNSLFCINVKTEPLERKSMHPAKENQYKLILENPQYSLSRREESSKHKLSD